MTTKKPASTPGTATPPGTQSAEPTVSGTAQPPATAPTAQPLLDLTRVVLAVRRKRRMWLTLALVGLLVGGALAVLMPTPPTAVTRIFVVHEDDQPTDSGRLMLTDVTADAHHPDRGRRAGAGRLTAAPGGLPPRLRRHGRHQQRPRDDGPREDQRRRGPPGRRARGRVHRRPRRPHPGGGRRRGQGADRPARPGPGRAEQGQRPDLRRGGRRAQNNRAATTTQAQTNAAGLDSLYARRAELTSRISDLGPRAEEAGIGAPRVPAGTQVVDDARGRCRTRSSPPAPTNAAIGLLLGLIIGWTLAAVTSVVQDRPVLRQEIAANLGASVIAQLPAPRRGLARLWRPQAGRAGTQAGRRHARPADARRRRPCVGAGARLPAARRRARPGRRHRARRTTGRS